MSRKAVVEYVRRVADDIENRPENDPLSAATLNLVVAALTRDPRLALARQKCREHNGREIVVEPIADVWETGDID